MPPRPKYSSCLPVPGLPALVTLAMIGAGFGFGAAAPDVRQIEFFENNIRPVLAAECYECHSATKQKGGLRLDHRAALLIGGESGPALVPGNATRSLLIQAITHEHPEFKMPKGTGKLEAKVIRNFITWVNDGAADPRTEPSAATPAAAWEVTLAGRKQWWSFQPVPQVQPPVVKKPAWSSQPVDRFIAAKLEEKRLTPAPPAEKRVLIRRATFTLTGLPPTTAEVETFLSDPAPDAFEKLVDRLLASPRFGERWARHWMDLMRYAESHGSEGDPEIPMAWRYRDYLIRALNDDVPVDQLIREHLAGDLLPQPRLNRAEGLNESMLGIASLRLNEHGYQPVDTLDEQVKTVDNQIDVLSKAFQGLTISCSRCHDHKFDPIGQRDFYALFGILASSRPAQVTVDAPEVLARNRRELTTLKSQIQSALATDWLAAIDQLPARLRGETTDDHDLTTVRQRVTSLEARLAEMESAARSAVLQSRERQTAGNPAARLPTPMARWSFDGRPSDGIGNLHGELLGGAIIRNGRLVLDGKEAYFRSATFSRDLGEKTLEAWVALDNLTQRAGGVLTVETGKGSIFDAIVFAEKEAKKWVPGSNNFRRSQKLDGPDETAKPGELIHLAVVYRPDNSVAFYRNGVPFAPPYTPSGPEGGLYTFVAGDAHVLLGRRHTGGGQAFLAGEIDEARIYDLALTPEQVAASFRAGPAGVSPEEVTKAMTPEQQESFAALKIELAKAQIALKSREQKTGANGWRTELAQAAGNPESPLHGWAVLRDQPGAEFTRAYADLVAKQSARIAQAGQVMAEKFAVKWDLRRDGGQWFKDGSGLSRDASPPGALAIEPTGERVVSGLYPAGFISHGLSQKDSGLLTSPRFKIETDNLSVLAAGGQGAMVRVIVDNYPLNNGGIFQLARLESEEPKWIRLDTSYRKGTWAYLEFGNYDDLTKPVLAKDADRPADSRSWFGAWQVVAHEGKELPKKLNPAAGLVLAGPAPADVGGLVKKYQQTLAAAVNAWRAGSANDAQIALLDYFVRRGLLPNTQSELPNTKPLVARYRSLETDIPVPRRAPGVIEGTAYDAPLMTRGDHLKPAGIVPRGYLQALGATEFRSPSSGRLELANAIANPANPLTARVMVNRIWHQLFGRGLVPTVDNFGRLGDKPTHPELLDFLAAQFMADGWSTKRMVRTLLLSRTWQMGSEPSAEAREIDPGNDLLSHFRVRRLEAEAIRDAMLAVAGELDATMYGKSVGTADRKRRSVYLAVRRNSLSQFLEVFDAPKPFTTLGKRDATNVPAQSLALLNDPFVIHCAGRWAGAAAKSGDTETTRAAAMFETALGRPPTAAERQKMRDYLAELAKAHGTGDGQPLENQRVWQDLAQSIFNLKEFIYIR
jgi:hypothetical protein